MLRSVKWKFRTDVWGQPVGPVLKSHAVKEIFLDYLSTLGKIPKGHRSQMLGVFFPPRLKRPGREADRSPPSSTEAKNEWHHCTTPARCMYSESLTILPLLSLSCGGAVVLKGEGRREKSV